MRFMFLAKFVVKTSLLLILLLVILSAVYDSAVKVAEKHRVLRSIATIAGTLGSEQSKKERGKIINAAVSSLSSSLNSTINSRKLTKRIDDVQEVDNVRIHAIISADSNGKKDVASVGILTSPIQDGTDTYMETRETDYIDIDVIKKRKIITDRYWELISRWNTFTNYTKKRMNIKLKAIRLKTKPLTENNYTFINTLGSLWRPQNQPESEEDDRFVPQSIWQMEVGNNSRLPNPEMKRILIYDKFRWWGKSAWKEEHTLDNCVGGFNQCQLTEKQDRKTMSEIDAVITVRDMFHTMTRVNVEPGILKINFILESPFSSAASLSGSNELLASYWRGSDIVTPYSKWVYFDPGLRRKKQKRNYAKGKTKSVAIFMSNCEGINNRLGYVRQLQKYISVDIYGDCGPFHCSRGDADSCFEMLRKDYRFYLAFENSNCRDYITEKFSENALKNDVIPVVLGAHPEDYKSTAPENSYIHVEDFDSPQELAVYLTFLEENENEYNKFFEWKGTGEFVSSDFFCRVCAMVHYADLYPPPKRTTTFFWSHIEALDSQMCLGEGRWFWSKPNPEGNFRSKN